MASANAMSAECCEGVVHIGTPNGTEIKVGDLDVYHHSSGQSSPSGCILFLTDIHGWKLLNNRLLCDVYARAGFEVYMPDLFQGDPMQRAPAAPPADQSDAEAAAQAAAQRMKQMEAWRARHGDDVVVPLIRQMVSELRTMHPTLKLGSIGFCWGGRYSILSAGGDQPLVDAFCAAHPSRVQVPTDIEAIQRTPGLWCLASTDKMFTPETIEAVVFFHLPHQIILSVGFQFAF
jgi:dienelactone hydrolase